jgi:predicted nucleic acid-binding protein
MLDTYAILEFFKGGTKGGKVKKLLEKDHDVYISVLSLYEAGTVLNRQLGIKKAQEYLRSILTYYTILDVNQDIALKAVELRQKLKLPAMDCLIYATGQTKKAKVVSGCKHFKEISSQKDVIII